MPEHERQGKWRLTRQLIFLSGLTLLELESAQDDELRFESLSVSSGPERAREPRKNAGEIDLPCRTGFGEDAMQVRLDR